MGCVPLACGSGTLGRVQQAGFPRQERTLQPLSPREIQARVRAGESAQQVSTETGWPLDRVERYAEQPLAERAFIADQALTVEIRRSGSVVSVRDTAVDVLARAGVNMSELVVDSARRADGKWTVTAAVPGKAISASWAYDHGARSLQPLDDDARRLMGVEPLESEVVAVVNDAPMPESRPRLIAVPDAEPEAEDTDVDALVEADTSVGGDGASDASDVSAAANANQETLSLPLPTEPRPDAERPAPAPRTKPKPKPKGRRASVPSWDEILFGTSTHDGD